MSGEESRKSKLSLWLGRVVIGLVITAGAFGIYYVNTSETLKWADWTGFSEGTAQEETRLIN